MTQYDKLAWHGADEYTYAVMENVFKAIGKWLVDNGMVLPGWEPVFLDVYYHSALESDGLTAEGQYLMGKCYKRWVSEAGLGEPPLSMKIFDSYKKKQEARKGRRARSPKGRLSNKPGVKTH
jgi:hypothetical protein